MRLLSSLSLALVFTCWTKLALGAESTDGETLATMRVDGTIQVDTQGRVASHTLPANLSPPLRSLINRAISDWSFDPPSIDGGSSAATANMRVTLSARHHGDDYVVGVDNVRFFGAPLPDQGEWRLEVERPLKYNVRAAGALSMTIRLSPDGTILEAFASQCTLYAWKKKYDAASEVCAELEKYAASMLAGRKYIYYAASGEGPTPLHSVATQALLFQWTDEDRPGEWRGEWRTPYRRAPWLDESAPRVGSSDLMASDGLVSNSGDLRLLTDLATAKP